MSTLITNIGELVTNDPDAGRPARRSSRTPRWSSRAAGSPGSARRPTRPAADERRRRGRPGGDPRLRRLPLPPGLRRRPGRRSSPPGWPGTPYAAGGIRTTVAATRAATDEQLTAHVARLVAEMRRQGTTTVEIKSGYGLTVARRGAQRCAVAAAVHRGDDVPRRARRPGGDADDPAGYVELVTGPMLEAARRTPAGSTCSASAVRSTPTRRGRCWPPARRRPARPAARQPARPRPGRPARRRARAGRGRPLHLPLRRGRRRAARLRHGRHAAARGGVLDPLALPGRPPAPRRRRARWRWRPTATPARATPPRCRCASRWPCGRWG